MFLRMICFLLAVSLSGNLCQDLYGHDETREFFQQVLALVQAEANRTSEDVTELDDSEACQLTINLIDSWTEKGVPGLVRVTNLATSKAVAQPGEFLRALNWYSVDETATIRVPRQKIQIEALHGLAKLKTTVVVDLRAQATHSVKISLNEFYDTGMRGLYSGNTHLHLMNLTHAEADRYLRLVPQSDDLDLVFLSLLRRIPDERNYVSNSIVERTLQGGELERLSEHGVVFGNGEEHRHNFGPGGEGYGHVMLLDLQKIITPVSIGPGIMREGTDGIPLQRGIQEARRDEATVVWCHNTFGFEDLPNWVSGLIDAQNIFDGGTHGSYEDSFYRYLNLGMRVPFSTGTDWFIYDFARVFVPVDGKLTTEKWLEGLRQGRSYITNGPFLELETERAGLGDTLEMVGPNRVTVVGRAMGRLDFGGLELVYNGKVVHRVKSERVEGYYTADLRHGLNVDKPGWFAMRIPVKNGKTELGRTLFAHTSPIYIRLEDRELFDVSVAKKMVLEMRDSVKVIEQKGTFANASERRSVLSVYESAIDKLQSKIAAAESN